MEATPKASIYWKTTCHPVVFHLDLNRPKPDIQVLWVLGLLDYIFKHLHVEYMELNGYRHERIVYI